MAKKRRVTTDQARFLAITFIDRVMKVELATGPGTVISPHDMAIAYLKDHLPEKWFDEQTSEASWEHVWQETRIQLENILECFREEAKRVSQENPGFKV